jgi:hypothetical protein
MSSLFNLWFTLLSQLTKKELVKEKTSVALCIWTNHKQTMRSCKKITSIQYETDFLASGMRG